MLRKRQAGKRISKKLLALVTTVVLAIAGVAGFAFAEQAVQQAEVPAAPTTVTADALPTWQINGVVWQQTTVGNTVYAVGSFTKARPPGVAAGGPGEINANNIFAFDITTGNPVPNFSHQLNGQALAVNASPDGATVYIGGDFTTVDGVSRNHLAAFDVASGALTAWSPTTDGQVRALQVSSGHVYAGGNFRSASGQARNRLAQFVRSSGAITTWAPSVDDGYVWAMALTPDKSSLVVGGSFTTIGGTSQYGMGRVDATTGAVQSWPANTRIKTAGSYGAITALHSDGVRIFGSGYAFGTGASFEGTFAADPTGNIVWVDDCLGDTYDVYPFNGALYSVSHSHDCTTLGATGMPDTSPRNRWQEVHASWATPTGTNGWKDKYGWDFTGLPNAANLPWYPSLVFGTYTSAGQAAWSITGSGQYLAFGGEFPRVNGVDQQGLTRFALPGAAPKKSGPIYIASQDPVATSTESGKVRIRWGAFYDRDQGALSYDLFRNNAKIASFPNVASSYWSMPALGYVDSGLTPGASYQYQVRATDADGNAQWGVKTPAVTVSGAVAGASTYQQAVLSDGATRLWRLGQSSGSTVVQDQAGFADYTAVTSATFGATGAITGDSNTAVSLTSTNSKMTTTLADGGIANPVTVEAWVKTNSGSGGRIVGFGDSPTGTSVVTDRVLYLDNSGKVNFTVATDKMYAARSSASVNDNQWHHVAGTFANGELSVYVDGKLGARVRSVPTPRDYLGYWRLGADNTNSFVNRPTNNSLVGTVDEVAVYPSALSQTQLQNHYVASGRTGSWPQVTDAYGKSVLSSTPDAYWRLSETSGSTVTDYSGGVHDATASGKLQYAQAGALTGNPNTAMGFTTDLFTKGGYVIDKVSTANPTVYSEEVWFKTGSTSGGKLMGFGSSSSGNSTSYDRHVYLTDAGKLRFGVNPGSQVILESPQTVNDNQWHHVVASQGAEGMRLYVDGALVASNTTATAQNYTGYWRLAQDNVWSGSTNKYFVGTLDEAAFYGRALSADEIAAHYKLGSGKDPNTAPTADFTSTVSQLKVDVDASASTDDGSIASYAWNFGDGSNGTGATASHTYAAAGTYNVTLNVTDNLGAVGTKTVPVTVKVGQAPTAAFTTSVNKQVVSVDGSSSTDADGTIASYAWNFGDGSNGTGATASHTYAAAGTYDVVLTVTDNDGLTNSTTKQVTASQNVGPTAAFTTNVSALTVSADGSSSTDADGTIASYAWNFGDGSNGTGATASHTYAAAGTYNVVLTVTDNDGTTGSVTHPVTVAGNQNPTAKFTSSTSLLTANVDASTSTDPDGTIASYAWDFGDGGTGTGATASHTYAAAGTYTVTLTVTDNNGGQGATTGSVTVAGATVYAADDFNRTVSAGWGSANTGGAWTVTGTASRWNVDGSGGTVSLTAGSGPYATLPVSVTNSETTVNVSVDKASTGGGQYVSVLSRYRSGVGDYRGKLRIASTGVVTVYLGKTIGTTTTDLLSANVSGLTYAPGDVLRVKFQVAGSAPATLKIKVWKDGTAEPGSWSLTTTDSSPELTAAGGVGFYPYLSGSATNAPVLYRFDNLSVGEITTP